MVKILKYYDKNAMGEKIEKKKLMKQTMIEEYQKLKKKICLIKNESLDEAMNEVNNELEALISKNTIGNIF